MGNKITGQAIRATLDVDALNASIQTLNSKSAALESTTALLEEKTKTLVDTKAPVIVSTASGDVATFKDGADGMPIKALVTTIEPKQDLHGYDHPWIGGGGKNLLPYPTSAKTAGSTYSSNGVTMTHNDNGTLSFAGTATANSYFYINTYTADHSKDFQYAPGNYILSSEIIGAIAGEYRFQMSVHNNGTLIRTYVDTGAGVAVTINAGETEAVYLYVPSGKNMDGVVIKPMLRLASETDATFAPYDNICLITGRTELPLYRYAEYDTEAEPTITVNWQNTVYGSQLDIVSGQMTVDVENFLVDGSTNISTISELTNVIRFWVYTGSRFQLPDAEHVTKIMCDRLVRTAYAADVPSYGVANDYPSTLIIKLPIGTCEATEEGIKAYLAANPIQFVLPLANPVTYQLTPQEVTTLLGNNAVWTDVEPVTVDYPADTGLVVTQQNNTINQNEEFITDIQNMIATVETTTTASKNYAIGDVFIYAGNLYKVTSSITADSSIVLGTNCIQTTLISIIKGE